MLCSECSDGTGSDDFMKWFKYSELNEMRAALIKDFTMLRFVALRTFSIIHKAKVILVSSLPDEIVSSVNMIPAKTVEEAYQKAKDILKDINNITIMPQGALTFPLYKK